MKILSFNLALALFLFAFGSYSGASVEEFSTSSLLNSASLSNVSTATTPLEINEIPSVKKWKNADKSAKQLSAKLVKTLLPLALRMSEELNLPSKCSRGMLKLLTGLKQMKLWAFQMIDATGKLPNGLINGNINVFGDYDECIAVEVPGNFRGQYCTVDVDPPLPERRPFVHQDTEIPEFVNISASDTFIAEFLRKARHYYRVNFRTSLCVPSTCSAEDVQKMVKQVLQLLGIDFDVIVPNCETKVDEIIFSTSEIVIMCVLGFLVLLAVTSTLIDVTLNLMSDDESYQANLSIPLKCLLCFSCYTNTVRILKKDDSPDSIKIFHGIKVITMLWIILNHTYYYLNYQACANLLNAKEIGNDVAFQFIANGFLNVETFFFISAVLGAYGVMKMKEKKLNVFLYIFRRLWRLTPPFMLVIATLYLVRFIGSGPVWKETVVDGLIKNCHSNWWTNLIYINNFIPSKDMCLQWTWYIPVDTHLYLISLIVLIPLKSNPRLAFMMNAVFFVSGIVMTAATHVYYGLHPTAIYAFNHPEDIGYFAERGYFRTYVHCSSYCVGLTVGYILATKRRIKIPLVANLFGWLTAFVLGLSVVYGVYDWNQGNVPSLLVSTIYTCTNKLVWALALAWITVSCVTGHGGIATKILSWSAFVPLGRLTYMAYLIHPIIQYVNTGSTRTLIRTEHRVLLYYYLGNVVLAYMCAYGLTLLFESPFMALEKVLFSPQRPKKSSTKSEVVDPEVPEINENISQYKKSSLVEDNGIYTLKIKQMEMNP